MIIAVISDTHGLLRPQALIALAGSDHILHAGDVGDTAILDTLRTIAPVTAIRGNIDTTGSCSSLPATEVVELAGKLFYLIHSLDDLDIHPAAAGISAVISGHTHKPLITWQKDVLYLNPGSIGPRRFSLPVSLAIIHILDGALHPTLIKLDV